MMIHTLTIDDLCSVHGGQAATTSTSQTAAPGSARTASDSMDDRIQDALDERDRERENDEFRAWEKRHPFQAMICQGDRSCMR